MITYCSQLWKKPDFKEDVGIVEFVGPGKWYGCSHCGTKHRRPVDVQPGQKVIFSTHGHQMMYRAGKEYVVLREPSIIAVVEGEPAVQRERVSA